MSTTTLQWLGQSFFKIATPGGLVVYIDPWKDFPPGNNLFPKEVSVDDADMILVTHGHLDHLGDTVPLAIASQKPNFKVVCNFEIMLYLMEQGVPGEKMIALNTGGATTVSGINITMVHALHSSGIGGFGPKALIEGGEAAGFMIKLENGGVIYHAGDTDLFGDMTLFSERFHPDVALLPIGGVYTMDPQTAVHAARLLNPKAVVPMHYGGTFQLPGTEQEFAQVMRDRTPDVAVLTPQPGDVVNIDAYLPSA
jgi:L-ascorbate metabolism protein UlaG (beta-lactamase superfamily)